MAKEVAGFAALRRMCSGKPILRLGLDSVHVRMCNTSCVWCAQVPGSMPLNATQPAHVSHSLGHCVLTNRLACSHGPCKLLYQPALLLIG